MPADPEDFFEIDDQILYYVTDLQSGEILEELPFKNFKYGRAKNSRGGWSASISHRNPKNTSSLLQPWRRGVFAARGTDVLGGGILMTRASDTESGMDVGGQGYMAYLGDDRRSIRGRLGMTYATGSSSLEITFTNVDAFLIVSDLIQHAAAYAGAANVSYQNLFFRGTFPPLGLSGINRTKTYWTYERKCIADAISDLAALYQGFEWAETYYFQGDSILRQLELYYPSKGLAQGLEFEAGRNVLLLSRDEDGTQQVTRYTATGSGSDDAQQFSEAIDLTQETPSGSYPLLEGIDSFQDYTQDMLDAQAVRGLNQQKAPPETIHVRVLEDKALPLGSFDWGDQVRIMVDDFALQVNGLYRIEQYDVEVDEQGKISISTVAVSYNPSVGLS